jgi:hypothetical protein
MNVVMHVGVMNECNERGDACWSNDFYIFLNINVKVNANHI